MTAYLKYFPIHPPHIGGFRSTIKSVAPAEELTHPPVGERSLKRDAICTSASYLIRVIVHFSSLFLSTLPHRTVAVGYIPFPFSVPYHTLSLAHFLQTRPSQSLGRLQQSLFRDIFTILMKNASLTLLNLCLFVSHIFRTLCLEGRVC